MQTKHGKNGSPSEISESKPEATGNLIDKKKIEWRDNFKFCLTRIRAHESSTNNLSLTNTKSNNVAELLHLSTKVASLLSKQ